MSKEETKWDLNGIWTIFNTDIPADVEFLDPYLMNCFSSVSHLPAFSAYVICGSGNSSPGSAPYNLYCVAVP